MNWGRLITAMVTPFDEELNVNYEQSVKLAQKLKSEKSSALVIGGTTGESPSLEKDELYRLIYDIKSNVDIPIIAGVGTNCTHKTIENIENIKNLNVDGLLVIVPYYNKPNPKSIYEHFKAVAESTDLPIMIYNVPGRTGVNITLNTLKELTQIKNICAIKEASGDVAQLSRFVAETPRDFRVYTGDDILTLPSLSVGAYGVVSVASHIVGRQMDDIINYYLDGDIDMARIINSTLIGMFDALFSTTNPIPVKKALNLQGFDVGGYRLPLTPPSEEIVRLLKTKLDELTW